MAPVISFLGFGYLSPQAVCFILILAVGNSINSMGVIGYYAEASGGSLSRLLRIHLAMMAINIGLGIPAGWAFGPVGAVSAYALSFTYGGLALLRVWAHASSTRLTDHIWPDRWIAIVAVFAFLASVGATFTRIQPIHMVAFSLGITALTCFFLAPFYFLRWRHIVLR
jgi:hypothetical protein